MSKEVTEAVVAKIETPAELVQKKWNYAKRKQFLGKRLHIPA